jgi:Tripartite ATP-independent periplasmic transporter, DctM component
MHPPFGFALFYLRSVAPKSPYTDKITGERLAGVSTGQIYWGAVPFVIIQVVMIGITIAFPQMVMHYKGTPIDPSSVEIKVPTLQPLAPGGTTLGAPTLGTPNFGTPEAEGGTTAPKLGAPVINP